VVRCLQSGLLAVVLNVYNFIRGKSGESWALVMGWFDYLLTDESVKGILTRETDRLDLFKREYDIIHRCQVFRLYKVSSGVDSFIP
jgi:hypothetical protein